MAEGDKIEGKLTLAKAVSEQEDALANIARNKDVAKDPFEEKRNWWKNFYMQIFGMEVDFTEVKIPQKPEGEEYILMFIPKWINIKKIISLNKSECAIQIPTEISVEEINSPYYARQASAVWVRKSGGPELKISNQRSIPQGKSIMTVEERIIFGLWWLKTQAIWDLDLEVPTLTSSYIGSGLKTKAITVRRIPNGMKIGLQNMHTIGNAREIIRLE